MTDGELLSILKKADDLLGQYKEAVQPAADELARRKSIKVYGKKGAYAGKLGCQESGSDTVCLHLNEPFRKNMLRLEDKAITFDLRWFRKAMKAGIKHIHISGFY
jgi:hypothetical protein